MAGGNGEMRINGTGPPPSTAKLRVQKESYLEWEQRIEEFARCRAHVLQAIHDTPGMTYVEIRLWIHAHYRYWMENVGARCRELYQEGYAQKELNGNRVHVYPTQKCPQCNTPILRRDSLSNFDVCESCGTVVYHHDSEAQNTHHP